MAGNSGLKQAKPGALTLRIGELAQRAGVGIDTLRYYERRGLLHVSRRSAGGQRRYAPDSVNRVLAIRKAASLGFKLAEIQHILEIDSRSPGGLKELRRWGRRKQQEVRRSMRQLAELDVALQQLVEGDPRPDCPYLEALTGLAPQTVSHGSLSRANAEETGS